MPGTQVFGRPLVGFEIVSHQYLDIFADVLPNVFAERTRSDIRRMEESEIAVALPNTDHDLFV